MSEIIKLVGKRWELMKCLLIREYYVTELANELDRQPPEMSVYLRDLFQHKLVEFKISDGDRKKYYKLSKRGTRIYEAFKSAIFIEDEESGPDDWKVEKTLEILLDEEFPQHLRESYSEEFVKLCKQYPNMIMKNERARELLEKIASDPPRDDNMVLRDIKEGLSAITTNLLQRNKNDDWVTSKIYPSLFEYVERNITSRNRTLEWALFSIRDLFKVSGEEQKERIRDNVLSLYFNARTRTDSNAGNLLIQVLKNASSRQLFDYAKIKAKDENQQVKLKGIKLLFELGNFT